MKTEQLFDFSRKLAVEVDSDEGLNIAFDNWTLTDHFASRPLT